MTTASTARLATALLTASLIAAGCSEGPNAAHASVPAPSAPATTPDQVVTSVAHGLADGKPHVAWDALPASYQKDITELVHTFAGKVDADLWNKGFDIVGKLAEVMRNQKDLIIAMPNFQQSPDFDTNRAAEEWDLVVAPMMTITNSDIADINSLKRIDIRSFLATTGAEFMSDLKALEGISPGGPGSTLNELRQVKATTLQQNGDSAVVMVEMPGRPAYEQSFTLVEGKWIPADMAADWSDEMNKARTALSEMSTERFDEMKPQIMQLLVGIDGTLDMLTQAETVEQFEQTARRGMFQAVGGIMSLSREFKTAGADAQH